MIKPGSAPGGSRLRPNHLRELLKVPHLSSDNVLLPSLTRTINTLSNGRASPDLSARIAVAPLAALAKPDTDVRTIAVGEFLRGLVSDFLCVVSPRSFRVSFNHSNLV